ncbi:cytochrome C biogenesis protein CycH [Loktanella sp. 5RATIMAR09]|uniref:c-type cytochrome biogenesis protein CcmI n=1 Tax=Loktanella sp. 5RATIMAR09 TaxID=1225655 RepID=UPI0006EBA066|nr:c-type cytochrome biogenesis protein CcmI [Loktanella sp. 5RATIMAR09]KQI72769.1 cytochrome C biogenesis protein CycH [Loktanella sp. 5RATIMAR09]
MDIWTNIFNSVQDQPVFWIVCAALTLGVTALMVTPLVRPKEVGDDNPDIAIYRAQLEEIDRDLERQLLEPEEAERARTEVARRLLAASNAAVKPTADTKPNRWLPAAIIAVMLGLGFGTYWMIGAPGYPDMPLQARLAASEDIRANRPSQAALEVAAPAPPVPDVPDEYRAAVEQLRVIAPTRPDDLEAWSRLAMAEVELRNYAGAAAAQQQVVAIKGDAAEPLDLQRLLDLKVVAAGGFVSPEAEALIGDILDSNAGNIAARYYLGLLYNQTDRPDLALRLWREIIENGDPANFHIASARAQVGDAAFRAGVDYALPEARGPSFEQMDAAQDMSEEDRQAMIGGMVAGLADRLATDGGPAEDWARLIRAYGVLGDLDAARTVWTEAQQVFVSSMRGMEILTNAARDAGVLEE